VAYQLPKPTNNLAVLCKPILIRCHPLQCLHNIQRSMRKKLQILVLNQMLKWVSNISIPRNNQKAYML
jgi:hypothetical protein